MTATPASNSHFAYLDGWRGIAILAVLAGHFFQIRGINAGRLGVELFFVLSGRLMCQILFIKGTTLADFYRRRAARIYPALLVFVTAYVLYAVLIEHQRLSTNAVAGTLLFYTNYLSALSHEQIPSLAHVWSLAIEEHSYILLSLLTVTFRRTRRYALPVITALAVVACLNGAWQTYALDLDYYQVYWRSDVRVASILMSASLCLHYHRHPPVRYSGWSLVALGLAGAILNTNPIPDVVKYSLGTLCFAIVVNRAAELPPLVINFMANKVFTSFGVASFSVYLWQQPFFYAMESGSSPLLMLASALMLGFFSYHLIEKPARRWINRLPIGASHTQSEPKEKKRLSDGLNPG